MNNTNNINKFNKLSKLRNILLRYKYCFYGLHIKLRNEKFCNLKFKFLRSMGLLRTPCLCEHGEGSEQRERWGEYTEWGCDAGKGIQ